MSVDFEFIEGANFSLVRSIVGRLAAYSQDDQTLTGTIIGVYDADDGYDDEDRMMFIIETGQGKIHFVQMIHCTLVEKAK